jgi:hypothetical protein
MFRMKRKKESCQAIHILKTNEEFVNRRTTDNTMAKGKMTNRDLQNIHIQLKTE